jgi:hypothetical protein
MILRS